MKIEIEIDEIEGYSNYSIKAGDKSTTQLTFDEALGLVAILLMPKNRIPCLQWLRTKEEHEEQTGKWLLKSDVAKSIIDEDSISEVEYEEPVYVEPIIPKWIDDKANDQFKINKVN
jgi:hypothetical protein